MAPFRLRDDQARKVRPHLRAMLEAMLARGALR
jgi:hypothetical protein